MTQTSSYILCGQQVIGLVFVPPSELISSLYDTSCRQILVSYAAKIEILLAICDFFREQTHRQLCLSALIRTPTALSTCRNFDEKFDKGVLMRMYNDVH